MLRRKKLLKIGRKVQVHKTAEQKAYEKLVATALANNKKRAKDKKYQEAKKAKATSDYYAKFPYDNVIEPNMGWLDGKTTKVSVFDPVNLDRIDTDEINAKRKAANIETTIEQAATEALDEVKRKATMVAVVCHKSGYQYIGSGKDSKDYGKKTSQAENI